MHKDGICIFFNEMDRLLDLTLFDEFQCFGPPEHFRFWTYSFLIAGARYLNNDIKVNVILNKGVINEVNVFLITSNLNI